MDELPWFEPQRGARFSMPAQTGPEAHPSTCTMANESLYWGKAAEGAVLTTHSHVLRL